MDNISNNIFILISAIICYFLLKKFYTKQVDKSNNCNNKYIKSNAFIYTFIFIIMIYIKEIIGTFGAILLGALGIYLADNLLDRYFKI